MENNVPCCQWCSPSCLYPQLSFLPGSTLRGPGCCIVNKGGECVASFAYSASLNKFSFLSCSTLLMFGVCLAEVQWWFQSTAGSGSNCTQPRIDIIIIITWPQLQYSTYTLLVVAACSNKCCSKSIPVIGNNIGYFCVQQLQYERKQRPASSQLCQQLLSLALLGLMIFSHIFQSPSVCFNPI